MPSFHIIELDENLSKTGELKRVRSINIERSITEKASMLESCTVSVDCETIPNAGWFRIERRNESSVDALGTFWLEAESTRLDRGIMTANLAGTSVLRTASLTKMPAGSYAPSGADAPSLAAQLIGANPSAPTFSGSASMPRAIVFAENCSALEAAWAILDSVGWRIRTDGYGRIMLEPMPESASLEITDTTHGVAPGLDVSSDSVAYTREYGDGIRCGDLVTVHKPRNGVEVTARVLSQSFSAGAAMMVAEKIGALSR